jgi:hypothetical protein
MKQDYVSYRLEWFCAIFFSSFFVLVGVILEKLLVNHWLATHVCR